MDIKKIVEDLRFHYLQKKSWFKLASNGAKIRLLEVDNEFELSRVYLSYINEHLFKDAYFSRLKDNNVRSGFGVMVVSSSSSLVEFTEKLVGLLRQLDDDDAIYIERKGTYHKHIHYYLKEGNGVYIGANEAIHRFKPIANWYLTEIEARSKSRLARDVYNLHALEAITLEVHYLIKQLVYFQL